MSSPLALLLFLTSLISFDHCVEAIQASRGEETRLFESRYFRRIPIYPLLMFGVNDNTLDDSRFKKDIGRNHAFGILKMATYFAQTLFGPDNFGRGYAYVELTITDLIRTKIATSIAKTTDTKLYVDSIYIENFVGDVKYEFDGVIFHKCAGMWLQSRDGSVPSWILTGMADFARLKGGWPSRSWPKKGSGTRWTDGYAITAYFLEYCSRIKMDFVHELNSMMKDGYSDEYFERLLGNDIGQLWDDYKSLYSGKATAPAPSLRQE